MGINFETRTFEIYLRHVGVKSKELTFESVQLSPSDLAKANDEVGKLYERLMRHWGDIVGVSRIDLLSPESP
jgi:hypothetical protein